MKNETQPTKLVGRVAFAVNSLLDRRIVSGESGYFINDELLHGLAERYQDLPQKDLESDLRQVPVYVSKILAKAEAKLQTEIAKHRAALDGRGYGVNAPRERALLKQKTAWVYRLKKIRPDAIVKIVTDLIAAHREKAQP